jgi:hypothetical protein
MTGEVFLLGLKQNVGNYPLRPPSLKCCICGAALDRLNTLFDETAARRSLVVLGWIGAITLSKLEGYLPEPAGTPTCCWCGLGS